MAKDVSSISSGDQAAEQADQIAKVVEAANQFACDLYSRVASSTPGNLFFSPSSVWTALAMTYAGAASDTAKEMAKTLHLDLPDDQLHPAIKLLHESIRPASVKLSITNRLWGQAGYRFLPEFTETIEQFYGASLKEVDFRGETETARFTINEWVEEQTAGRIVDLFPPGTLSPLARLVLVNAIHFLGRWDSVFDEADTRSETFWTSPGSHQTVPMMHQVGSYPYRDFGDVVILEMPYQSQAWPLTEKTNEEGLEGWTVADTPIGSGDLTMTLLLHREINGLGQIEAQLWPDSIRRWTKAANLGECLIDLGVPRFRIKTDIELKRTLASLGMHRAFSIDDASFSRMSHDPEGLFLSAVLHKAFVDVNEEGTEAAAATGGAMFGAGRLPEPTIVRVDHPFVFLIRDRETGLILFCGRVADPSA